MKSKPSAPVVPTPLRRVAEAQIRQRAKAGQATPSAAAPRRLVHELQVHQIELELQHAELLQARDRAEALLDKYTELYDFAPVGYFTLGWDGAIRQVNLTGARMLGIERSRLVGRLFGLQVDAKNRTAFQALLERTLASKSSQTGEMELEVLRADRLPLIVRLETQRSADGEECRAVVIDTTERARADLILRRAEALFFALFEQAPFGVYVVDARFQMQQVNPAGRASFMGIQPLIGRDFSEIVHQIWPKRAAGLIVAHFRHTLRSGEPFQSPEFAHRRRDLDVRETYEWQIQRVTLPAGEHGVVCFFNNVTERKQAEETQRRLDVMTATNQKLEAEIVRRSAVEESLRQSERDQFRLLEQSRRLQEQRRRLSHEILRTQEDERRRISRELHDVISQTLTGINLGLEALGKSALAKPESLGRSLALTQRRVAESIDVVHRFARELRPSVLDDLGLLPALEDFVKRFAKESRLRVHVTLSAEVEQLDKDRRAVLYRVAQESLTNVARHAQAGRVDVSLSKRARTVVLEIRDDGCSFPVDRVLKAEGKPRLGLIGMRERVEMCGGTFRIESAPGAGTVIRVELPFAPSKVGRVKAGKRGAGAKTSGEHPLESRRNTTLS